MKADLEEVIRACHMDYFSSAAIISSITVETVEVAADQKVTRKGQTSHCKSSPLNMSQCTKEEEMGDKKRKPEWLEFFLRRVFFDSCPKHPIWRNELKKYCINCDVSACQYCISLGGHRQCTIIKIYRHVYKDVVSLHPMEKHVDCSEIQPYKSNKRLVIALNPLPHYGPSLADRATCKICKRRLTDAELYKYCSISCKVMAFSSKSSQSEPPFLSVEAPEIEEWPRKICRKRKGTPQRAPFF